MSMHKTRLYLTLLFTLVTLLVVATLLSPVFHAYSALASSFGSSSSPLYSLVNPFVGTGVQQGAVYGGGNTFPGADAPFGMVQWSPETTDNAPGGYDYTATTVKGFSLTHFSGAGCSAYGDIPFMPYVGTVTDSPATDPTRYVSGLSHANESANAGYYQATLANGVKTELTALQRSGAARFTYPQSQVASLLVNVSGSATGTTDAQATIGTDTISGYAASGAFCGSINVYRVYFWAQFSQPFATLGTWSNGTLSPNATTARGSSPASATLKKVLSAQAGVVNGTVPAAQAQTVQHLDTTVSGPGSGAYVTFDTSSTTAITVKVGVSFVSVDNAQANVNQDNASGNFTAALNNAHTQWNQALSAIAISGGTTTQQTIFYTALYHALLQPNVFSDSNGQYIGFDGAVHTTAAGHIQYANYSGWDIYRSEIQLLALLYPARASDIVQSMVNDYTQSGMLPKWSQANAEAFIMAGDPADAIISSAYAFGAQGFDTQTALQAMVSEATQGALTYPGANYLETLGYEPVDGSYACCNFYGAASTTLEYDTADFSIAAMAQALGDTTDYQSFVTRAQNWENLYDPATGNLEPRAQNGSFLPAFHTSTQNNWIEGNGAQYNWMVPFNLQGLFTAFGGTAKAQQRLDTFFQQLNAGPLVPNAFLGNEPTLETPWEYDYAGAPYKTQNVVRQVVNTLYTNIPGGLAGNDDLGEMSSWYVFAALGFFPETPGTANLALGSPLFPSITVHRSSGQVLRISAPQASANTPYIQSLQVNGHSSTNPWLPASFIGANGTLNFVLSSTPNTTWGSAASAAPPSYQTGSKATLVALTPGRATIAPGSSAQVNVVAQNVGSSAVTVNWSATASSGLTLQPSSGSFQISARNAAKQPLTVTVPGGQAEGVYNLAFTATTSAGTSIPISSLTVAVARPGNLLGSFNNVGLSDDTQFTQVDVNADYDGNGNSYSAEALAAAGYTPGATVTANGVSYTLPDMQPGSVDNIVAGGQILQVPGAQAGATSLTFLGSSTNGPASGTVTITYTDGSTQTAQLGFADWTLNGGFYSQPQYNNVIAATMSYHDASNRSETMPTYVFATAPIALNTSKQVASVTLPSSTQGGELHILSLAVS